MDVAQGQIGTEGAWEVDFKGGKAIVSAKHEAKGSKVAFTAELDSGYLMDVLAAKIPGVIDDAILGMMKQALKAL